MGASAGLLLVHHYREIAKAVKLRHTFPDAWNLFQSLALLQNLVDQGDVRNLFERQI